LRYLRNEAEHSGAQNAQIFLLPREFSLRSTWRRPFRGAVDLMQQSRSNLHEKKRLRDALATDESSALRERFAGMTV
jgi:hypothetical protein